MGRGGIGCEIEARDSGDNVGIRRKMRRELGDIEVIRIEESGIVH